MVTRTKFFPFVTLISLYVRQDKDSLVLTFFLLGFKMLEHQLCQQRADGLTPALWQRWSHKSGGQKVTRETSEGQGGGGKSSPE